MVAGAKQGMLGQSSVCVCVCCSFDAELEEMYGSHSVLGLGMCEIELATCPLRCGDVHKSTVPKWVRASLDAEIHRTPLPFFGSKM